MFVSNLFCTPVKFAHRS